MLRHYRVAHVGLENERVVLRQTDEWTEARRYMGTRLLAKARPRIIGDV